MKKIRLLAASTTLAAAAAVASPATPAHAADTWYAYCGTTYAQLIFYPNAGGSASTRLSYSSGLFTAANNTATLWTTKHAGPGISVNVNQGHRFTTYVAPPAHGSLITIKAGPLVAPVWLDCRVGQVGAPR